MIEFIDGPVQRRSLRLKRTPAFLRAVYDPHASAGWDALDQLNDEPAAIETIYAYQMVEPPSMIHIHARVGGGWYAHARYQLVKEQPADGILRDSKLWDAWVNANRSLVSHLFPS
jgi:hypothetical protein